MAGSRSRAGGRGRDARPLAAHRTPSVGDPIAASDVRNTCHAPVDVVEAVIKGRQQVRSRRVERLLTPLQAFIRAETSGGVVLLAFAVAGLVWANSPWRDSYQQLFHGTSIELGVADYVLEMELIEWINDALMAVFFLLVGLEIKREFLSGALSQRRQAMLPIFGAVGGMVVPAALYVALNLGSEGIRGWGVPMATDIAFVIGVMAVIGRRVPPGLKVFLVALAIVDDIGAVLVIATFYTASIDVQALVVMLGFFIALLAMNRLGVQRISVYVVLGLGLWLATLESGVHATIAGVLLALTIPARAGTDAQGYVERARRLLDDFVRSGESGSGEEALSRQQASLQALEGTYQDMTSPLQKMEHALQPRVVYVIVPIFALANAGVSLTGEGEASLISAVSVGIILGLVLGKPIGISLAAWLAVKAGIAGLPSGVRWRQIVGAGMLGGIGFTMSLFIAALAFGEQAALLTNAKLGILVASAIAGVIGYAFLRATPRRARDRRSVD